MRANTKRPHVLIKTAMSLNGKIGDLSTKRVILSNKEDIAAVDALRAQYDAILIGEATLKKDNPRLILKFPKNARERLKRGLTEHPVKVTLSKKCDIDTESNFLREGSGEKFVFTATQAPSKNVERIKKYARVFCAGEKRVDIKKMLAILYTHGVRKLMVEGGGRTNYEFLKAGVVDEMRVAVAPIIIGLEDAPAFAYGDDFLPMLRFSLKSVERLKNMVVLCYARK